MGLLQVHSNTRPNDPLHIRLRMCWGPGAATHGILAFLSQCLWVSYNRVFRFSHQVEIPVGCVSERTTFRLNITQVLKLEDVFSGNVFGLTFVHFFFSSQSQNQYVTKQLVLNRNKMVPFFQVKYLCLPLHCLCHDSLTVFSLSVSSAVCLWQVWFFFGFTKTCFRICLCVCSLCILLCSYVCMRNVGVFHVCVFRSTLSSNLC